MARPPREPWTPATAAHLDPGLQPERTTLAWTRTCLALVTVSAVCLRWLPHFGPVILLLPLATGAAAAVILATQRLRTARGVAAISTGARRAEPAQPLALTLLLLAVSGAALAIVVPAP